MSHDEATASPFSDAQSFSNHSSWPVVTFLLVIRSMAYSDHVF